MYILEIESICQTTNHVIGFHYLRITFQYVGIQFLQKFLNFKLIIHQLKILIAQRAVL